MKDFLFHSMCELWSEERETLLTVLTKELVYFEKRIFQTFRKGNCWTKFLLKILETLDFDYILTSYFFSALIKIDFPVPQYTRVYNISNPTTN